MRNSPSVISVFVLVFGVGTIGGCSRTVISAFPSSGASGAAQIRPMQGSRTFDYEGRGQIFTVPSGVTQLTITADGASGMNYGSTSSSGYGTPGNGGLIEAMVPVKPGQKLHVFVGGSNGFNGGTSGSYSGGGGASDVRQGGSSLGRRILVAAGGGGGGYIGYNMGNGGNGGDGGGWLGRAGIGGSGNYGGDGRGGRGGTQHHGGKGGAGGIYPGPRPCRDGCGYCNGAAGSNGKFGTGGAGSESCGGPGGGGGGGYYGGGGGGSGFYEYFGVSFQFGAGGGGGGGSSYLEKTATLLQNVKGGAPPGDGQIIISW